MPGRAVLVDTNLLLLLAAGQFDPSLIGRKRLDVFSLEDHSLLQNLIKPFDVNLTTPHVLSELGNLADALVPEKRQSKFREFLAGLIKHFNEKWVPATELCTTGEYRLLGLTDSAICRLAKEAALVLTVDVRLYLRLSKDHVDARNFNHFRTQR